MAKGLHCIDQEGWHFANVTSIKEHVIMNKVAPAKANQSWPCTLKQANECHHHSKFCWIEKFNHKQTLFHYVKCQNRTCKMFIKMKLEFCKTILSSKLYKIKDFQRFSYPNYFENWDRLERFWSENTSGPKLRHVLTSMKSSSSIFHRIDSKRSTHGESNLFYRLNDENLHKKFISFSTHKIEIPSLGQVESTSM